MKVQIDISGNLKKGDEDSYLGVADTEGTYSKSVHLSTSVKKKIKKYQKYKEEVHVSLIYILIKDDIHKYSSIQICPDISKNAIHNKLLRLFKESEQYEKLRMNGKIKISAVGHDCQVDRYVSKLRRGKEKPTKRIGYEELNSVLQLFKGYRNEEEILSTRIKK